MLNYQVPAVDIVVIVPSIRHAIVHNERRGHGHQNEPVHVLEVVGFQQGLGRVGVAGGDIVSAHSRHLLIQS